MRVMSFVSAAAIAVAALAPASDAMAQRNRGGAAVVVVNYQRIANESAYGRDMATKLQQIQTQVQQEGQALAPEQQSLEQERQRLATATRNMTPQQIQASTTYAPQFQNFQQRARQLEVRAATLRGDYECSEAVALRGFNGIVNPIVEGIMRQRGAAAAIDASSARVVLPENDITQTVIQQLDANQATRVAAVTRQPVATCLPQQQAAAPAPAAPAPQ